MRVALRGLLLAIGGLIGSQGAAGQEPGQRCEPLDGAPGWQACEWQRQIPNGEIRSGVRATTGAPETGWVSFGCSPPQGEAGKAISFVTWEGDGDGPMRIGPLTLEGERIDERNRIWYADERSAPLRKIAEALDPRRGEEPLRAGTADVEGVRLKPGPGIARWIRGALRACDLTRGGGEPLAER